MSRTTSNLQHTLSSETPYQLVMITAMLELLLLAALTPRTADAGPPLCFAAVSSLRFAALTSSAALLATQRRSARPLEALIALGIWSALLAPPELWASALELRAGLPPTLFSSFALAIGLYAALRLHRIIGWGFLTLIFATLYAQRWQLESLSAPLVLVTALGIGLWIAAFKAPTRQGEPA